VVTVIFTTPANTFQKDDLKETETKTETVLEQNKISIIESL